jgi:uncharacterized protein (TIGR03086 family)
MGPTAEAGPGADDDTRSMTEPELTVSELIARGRDREAAARGIRPAGDSTPKGLVMNPLEQFAALGPHLAGVIDGIGPADLDLPTPCADFTVRGVLEHMVAGATAFTAAFRGEVPGEPDLGDPLGTFLPALGGLGEAVATPGALDRTIAAPFGAVPGNDFARFVVLDGLVHGWDLATATGQHYAPPDDLVAAVDAFARGAVDPLRDGTAFGPEAPPPTGATPLEALVAYTGRMIRTPGETTPNRALWEKGDFTRIAATMRQSGDEFVTTLGITEGMAVLDVGCGDGTTAIPAAERGAEVLGVDIATNLVAAGRRRARALGLDNCRFETGDVRNLAGLADASFDLVVSVFGAMFAPDPLDVAAEVVRVTRPGGRIVMGNWIPGDPTLVAQILRISAAYAPPPAGVPSPMQWGQPDEVRARFAAAGIPESAVGCEPNTFTFRFAGTPAQLVDEFRDWYGPTMNAFAAAAGAGREADLHAELVALFEQCNESTDPACTVIPATFLRVTVDR